MKINRKLLMLVGVLVTISTLLATDGYLRNGYGVKYSALAGAGVALPLSSLAGATNPAALVYVGNRYDVSFAYFSPSRDYTITGAPSGAPNTFGLTPGKVESESKSFFIPTLGANWMIASNMSLGVVLFANGGMNTDYPTPTFYDQSSPGTGINLEQMFLGGTYSIEFVENHAFGVTALFGFQRFSAKGLAAFSNFSADASALTGNRVSTATGFGARVGYFGKILPMLSVGVSYQTKIYMSEFKEYKGLFAEEGDFDVPANWTAGIAVNATPALTFALDVKGIMYSQINSVANKFDPMALPPAFPDGNGGFVPNPNHKPLGSKEGSGFGWKDATIIKFGTMWKSSDEWTWMLGYSYGKQPIEESEVLFNILAPAVVEHHITFGVSRSFCGGQEINLAVMYAPSGSVSGPNPLEAPNQQTIELQMSQLQVEIGYAFH